jgi:hypothetical protein
MPGLGPVRDLRMVGTNPEPRFPGYPSRAKIQENPQAVTRRATLPDFVAAGFENHRAARKLVSLERLTLIRDGSTF